MDLEDEVYEKIEDFSEKGNTALENNHFEQAIHFYNCALSLLPKPHEEWDAAGWLWVSIGDALFQKGDFQDSCDYMLKAYTLSEMIDNPFVLLRLGQCSLELNKENDAIEYLLRAHMLEGPEIFKGSSKYLDFLKEKVEL